MKCIINFLTHLLFRIKFRVLNTSLHKMRNTFLNGANTLIKYLGCQ
jgi:hypothetical protein